jgi:hypothetical protein
MTPWQGPSFGQWARLRIYSLDSGSARTRRVLHRE